ncbi:FecR family protein [Arsenicitalea aurantiaca]|uniref:FecR family protein n=1 Tax=Arsenicitalea aurantiaca TaxID=1783274 RepID=UPI0013158D14|nr:FecR domain-containing protein [Arsenicitalea aurantiaca]
MQKALVVAVGLALALSTPASAQMGRALGVTPEAQSVLGAQVRTLTVGTDVTVGERVETGPNGLVELLFSERTKLVVGPGSALLIEEYLLRSDQTASSFAVNALSGTFRFMSGQSPKSAYQIRTPTGTIGVRGTEFDFAVTPTDTNVILYSGEATLCAVSGNCVELTESCALGTFSNQTSAVLDSNRGTRSQLRPLFPFSTSQYPLSYAFRVNQGENCLNPPPVNPNAAPFSEPAGTGDGTDPPPSDPCPTGSLIVPVGTERVQVADMGTRARLLFAQPSQDPYPNPCTS